MVPPINIFDLPADLNPDCPHRKMTMNNQNDQSTNDKEETSTREAVAGWALLIFFGALVYFGWQAYSKKSQSEDLKNGAIAALYTGGYCFEFNDLIESNIAQLEARGFTSGNDTYFLLTDAQSETARLLDGFRSLKSALNTNEITRSLSISADQEFSRGRVDMRREFPQVLATGNRSLFLELRRICATR